MTPSDLINAYQESEHFHDSRKFSSVPSQSNPSHPRSNYCCDFQSHRLVLLILECLLSGIIHYVCLCFWLFTQHNARQIPPHYLCQLFVTLLPSGLPQHERVSLSIHSHWGHPSCSQLGATMKKAAMNTLGQGLFVDMYLHVSCTSIQKWSFSVTEQTYIQLFKKLLAF